MLKSFEQFIKESEDLFVPRNLEGREDRFFRNLQMKLNSCNGIWKENLDLKRMKIPLWFKIPDNLSFERLLDLSGSSIEQLPKNLKCRDLYLCNCKNIKTIPNDLKITNLIDLSGSSIKQLPENLSFFRLYLKNCKNFKELPENINVENIIDLSGSSIERLPKNLKCYCLYLKNCQNIKELQQNININCIHLNGSSIERLPKNLRCIELSLINCKNIKELPQGLNISINLNIKNSSLTREYCKQLKKEGKINYFKLNG